MSTASNSASLSSCRSFEYASGNACSTPRSVCSEAATRGAFPRRSSAASGFFFCGMMLEPEEKSSAGSEKPNSWLDQSTSSDPSRERCVAQIAAAER